MPTTRSAQMPHTVRRVAHATLLAVAASIALSVNGCSLLVERGATQCETDADCRSLGSAFVGARCSTRKVCEVGARNNSGNEGGESVACTTNRDCNEALGAPSLCRSSDRLCVRLLTAECDRVVGRPADDNVLVIGGLVPKAGPESVRAITMDNAAALATDEINAAGGVPLGSGAGARSIVYVSCNEGLVPAEGRPGGIATDPAMRERVVRHLTEAIGAPVIIGASSSDATLEVARLTIPKQTLLVSPTATAAAVSALADDGLVWQIPPSDDVQAKAVAAAVSLFDGRLRPGVPFIRVALVVRDDPYGRGLADALLPDLVFNDAKATAAENAALFRRVDYPNPRTNANPDLSGVVQALVDFKPQLIVGLGGDEWGSDLLRLVEENWSTLNPNPPRPLYVLPHEAITPALAALAGSSESGLLRRVLLTQPGRKTENRGSLALRYKARDEYRNTDVTVFGAPATYDAVYLAALASVGSTAVTLDGPALASGLKKLVPPGAPIDVGPSRIASAIQSLRSGQSIDVNGAFGRLDFDVAVGTARDDADLVCMELSGGSGAITARPTGRYIDSSTGKLVGTFTVPTCAGF